MRLLNLLIGCAIGVAAVAQTPMATLPQPFYFNPGTNYGPVGLGSTETMQVNLLNAATPAVTSSTSAPVCAGTISFLNGSGAVINSPVSFSVNAGQIFAAALPFTKAGIAGIRGEIRVQITLIAPAKNALPCSLQSSLETFDSVNGATHVYLSNPQAQSVGAIFSAITGVLSPVQN